MTNPIHIHSTSEYLVVSVSPALRQNDLFMLSYWEQDLENWLRSWGHPRMRLVLHLNVSWKDTKGSRILKKLSFPLMLREDGLQVLMDARSQFPVIPSAAVDT